MSIELQKRYIRLSWLTQLKHCRVLLLTRVRRINLSR